MSGLKNLIRLHEWTVDERRRGLGAHIRILDDMELEIEHLEEDLLREQALAGADPSGLNMTFAAYHKRVRAEQDDLRYRIRQKEAEIREARDILSAAYMELKKYEVAQEVRDRKESLKQAREEQNELDEQGLQLYRRRRAARAS